MNYDKLDNDELLRLALDAINHGRDAESVVMLKMLLERDPAHVFGQYLLAAQHAQLGMFDRAEAGFHAVVSAAPDFHIARFQLAQLLMLKGATNEMRPMLAPVAAGSDALGAYARALLAATNEDVAGAINELDAGLALPQEIPALTMDMQRLRDQFKTAGSELQADAGAISASAGAPMFLANYAREA